MIANVEKSMSMDDPPTTNQLQKVKKMQSNNMFVNLNCA
jgi:hypothetical protein